MSEVVSCTPNPKERGQFMKMQTLITALALGLAAAPVALAQDKTEPVATDSEGM